MKCFFIVVVIIRLF